MIDQILDHLRSRLNAKLSARYADVDDLVVLSPLVDVQNQPVAQTHDRLSMFLVNATQNTLVPPFESKHSTDIHCGAPLHLDLWVMIAAGHDADVYRHGLKLLSSAISFFQLNPVFTPQNSPEFPSGIEQIALEFTNLTSQELAQLWGCLGGRYVPSALYKVRGVVFGTEEIRNDPMSVRGIKVTDAQQ